MARLELADVKWQLRIDGTAEDDALEVLIDDAQGYVERYCGLVSEEREVTQTFDAGEPLRLRAWPVSSSPITLTYLDAAGQPQPYTDFRLKRCDLGRAELLPIAGSLWPRSVARSAVTATFTAGDGETPPAARRALLVLIAGYYSDRTGGETAQAAERAATSMLKKAGFRLISL